ncbi:MAG: hypothetical protein K2J20_00240, partial [Bacilli bacterium]|nr:hypothetical protein [Bacilli bacterium]
NTLLHKDIDKFFQDFLNSLNNSLVRYDVKALGKDENTTHYIAFYADEKANYNEALKVYFPVKYEYMISSLKTIFLYLIRNSIKATVKFHVKSTNEGIVIRFYNKKAAIPFINYCNNNFELKDLLEDVNPFIATIYGIGIVEDDNTVGTYNQTLSNMLTEYFMYVKNNNLLEAVSDLDFLDYVRKRGNIEADKMVKFNIKAVENNVTAILNHKSPINEKDLNIGA